MSMMPLLKFTKTGLNKQEFIFNALSMDFSGFLEKFVSVRLLFITAKNLEFQMEKCASLSRVNVHCYNK